MKCETCRFFTPYQSETDAEGIEQRHGFCKRYAPRPGEGLCLRFMLDEEILVTGTAYCPVWPLMNEEDGCGEWQSKESEK